MWGSQDASDDDIPGDFRVGVISCRDFEFNLVRIIVSEVWELDLEDTILFSDDLSFATVVAGHACGDRHVLKWVLVLGVDELADYLSVLAFREDLVDWHVNDFRLTKAFDLLVLTDGH